MTVRAKRLGWDEITSVQQYDILDPYDYTDDDLFGELETVTADGPFVKQHDVFLVNGQVADPTTIVEVTVAERDAYYIVEYLWGRGELPSTIDPSTWNYLPDNLPGGFDRQSARAFVELRQLQIRANPHHDNKGRFASTGGRVDNSVVDDKVAELQKQDPEKYWTVSPTHEGAKTFRIGDQKDPEGYVAFYELKNGDIEIGTLVAIPGNKGIARKAVELADEKYPGQDQVLDAFDTVVPVYTKLGFEETNRLTFDPAYAPVNWKPAYGTPDVVFMRRKSGAEQRSYEQRSIPFADVERSLNRDANPCKQCLANIDPQNVPVHPGCHCDVKTVRFIQPQVTTESIHQLSEILSTSEVIAEFEVPALLEIAPESVAAFDEGFRFSDLLEYVSEHEDLLQNANSAIALIFDEDQEVTSEREDSIGTIVTINDLLPVRAAERPQWTPRSS